MMNSGRAQLAGLLAVCLVAAGCVGSDRTSEPLEAASRATPRQDAQPTSPGVEGATWRGTLAVSEAFVLGGAEVNVAPEDAPAVGGPEAPVRLDAAMPTARTALTRDHWFVAIRLAETSESSVPPGLYEASLVWDGVARGAVVLERPPDTRDLAGARLVFDLGPVLRASTVYALTVVRLPDAAFDVLALDSARVEGAFVWRARDASSDAPVLVGKVGRGVRLDARNVDGAPHNIAIVDAAGRTVAGPSPLLRTAGDLEVLGWMPTHEGEYAYVCTVHPGTMRGVISIAT